MKRLALALVCAFCALPVYSQTIKKCQDEEGKWHYGDNAAVECERSRITEIDESGVLVKHVNAPPTQEELDAKRELEARVAEQKKTDAMRKAQDQRLLATYDDAESIARTRDALMSAVESGIIADRSLRERLMAELADLEANPGQEGFAEKQAELQERIEEFSESIRDRLAKKELVRERYSLDLQRFEELTGGP